MPMLKFIDKILCSFESCFSRKAAFQWFVVIVVGLMLRSDKLGLTSVIRDLALQQDSYLSMLHFFRASSWALDEMRQRWFQTVKEYAPLYREQEWCVLIGDGVKQSKEGRRIPGVKKLFQESENSAKPAYIHGHMFGGLGILAGNSHARACIPLSIRLHDGLSAAGAWTGTSASSHIVKMVEDAYLAAKEFGNALLLLDRYFLSVPALERLAQLNREGSVRMEIVSKAKRNCTAYEKPAPHSSKRGVRRKKEMPSIWKHCFLPVGSSFWKQRLCFMVRNRPSAITASTCSGDSSFIRNFALYLWNTTEFGAFLPAQPRNWMHCLSSVFTVPVFR